ncbi:protein-L-isoaspartate O-methyltransferase [Alteraurantiacibacter aquimixticola]|uniref:Protein-L-isoaspartate O-methyltransferase n=2 Tax=Alteraurantiacibacter aquimixticola TaxID=2489173 RepID=A0A4T3F3S3_9SPHN|nr:protein-L-isoaspartate O-methyltransferase [Alteraurantiacibacter aquimixticola]
MIDSQLRTSGVTDPVVVGRMREVKREEFVPESAKGVAYMDRAVPLGDGKYLAAPIVQGMLLQEAKPGLDESAIVVDGGSGYLAELLRPLVASLKVMSVEEALAPARGGKKVDLIIVDGAIEQLPDSLAKRLADDGRIVTGMVHDGVTSIARGRKSSKQVVFMPLGEVGIPRLSAFDKPKGWSF